MISKDGTISDDPNNAPQSCLDIGYGITGIHVGRSKPHKNLPRVREWTGDKRDVTLSATHCVVRMMSDHAKSKNLETTSYEFEEGTLIFKPKCNQSEVEK